MNNKGIGRRGFIKSGLAGSLAAGAVGAAGASRQAHASPGKDNVSATDDNRQEMYLDTKRGTGPFSAITKERPNIFLITADMISPDSYLPSRGISSHVNLPNIRSIGEQGTRCDNALCTSPLCGPARASMFTGTYPPYLTNGERAPLGMKTDLDSEDIIFQQYLRKTGYATKHVGKCHVGTHKFMEAFGENDAAWDRWAPPLMEDDGYAAFLKRKNVTPPVYKKELRGKQFDRKSPGNSLGGWIRQANGKDFPLDAHYSVYLAEKAVEKLDAASKQAPDSPLYLELDFFDPHQPYSIPSGFEARAAELRKHIKLPESYKSLLDSDFAPVKDEPPIYSVYRRYWGAYDPELVKDYILGHFLQMEVVDYAVGILLAEISRRGLWDDSLIIFTGDHGEINGRRGLFDKGVYFQPDIFRVPMMVKLPATENQTVPVYEKPVSSLDVSKTILDCAGIAAKDRLDGVSLVPTLTGKDERPALSQLFQTGWHVGVNYGVGINVYDDAEHHWFYGYNICGGEEELYNMAVDDGPNLINDSRYRDIHVRIARQLAVKLQSDSRWLGYWSTFRLHRAEILPKSDEDMQMFVPKKH